MNKYRAKVVGLVEVVAVGKLFCRSLWTLHITITRLQ